MNSTNNTGNTNNNAGVALASPFNRFMASAETIAVSKVTDSFLRRRFDATSGECVAKLDSLAKDIFDKEMLKLNANADLRLRLNYVSLMTIEIASYYINAKDFIDKLYKNYSLETLFQIYKNARDEPSLRVGLSPLAPVELPYFQERYLDITHLLRVDEYLTHQNITNPSWDMLEYFFDYAQPKTPIGLNYESDSIDSNCQLRLAKTIGEVDNILGNSTNLCIATKCILSDAIAKKEETLLLFFSIPTYYAAKAFVNIFPLMPSVAQARFMTLDFWEQENFLIDLILDDTKPYTESIRNEYISSLLQTYPVGK